MNPTEPQPDQPLSVTHDPRFTHWVQPLGMGGAEGKGQYWLTSEADALAFRDELSATAKRRYGAYCRHENSGSAHGNQWNMQWGNPLDLPRAQGLLRRYSGAKPMTPPRSPTLGTLLLLLCLTLPLVVVGSVALGMSLAVYHVAR
jgi:hypothetical protein